MTSTTAASRHNGGRRRKSNRQAGRADRCKSCHRIFSPLLFMNSEWATPSIVPTRKGLAKKSSSPSC